MNTTEACDLLGIPVGASADEVKKAFKKKAIEFHPDKNKDPGAEEKFKKINEANQFLEKNGTAPNQNPFNMPFGGVHNINDQINDYFRHVYIHQQYQQADPSNHIYVDVPVTFAESVLGAEKQVEYERKVKCNKCQGDPNCSNCNGKNEITVKEILKISIVPGTTSVTKNLRNKGHFNLGQLYVKIRAAKDKDMRLEGADIVSNITLTLLEALQGVKKTVRTIKGEKVLTLGPKTKNGDIIRVNGFGVPPFGSHIIKIAVEYPEDVTKIIEILEGK
jgi:molecular chaperone DnaJ